MEYELPPDEPVSVGVVNAVSDAEDCEPTALPPLYDYVDPDALDTLFPPAPERDSGQLPCVSFEFSNSRVYVDNHDHISVDPAAVAPVQKPHEK